MTRELRASVYEDKNTSYLKESQTLLGRNFDSRWVNSVVVKQQTATAEEIYPKKTDIEILYRNETLPEIKY